MAYQLLWLRESTNVLSKLSDFAKSCMASRYFPSLYKSTPEANSVSDSADGCHSICATAETAIPANTNPKIMRLITDCLENNTNGLGVDVFQEREQVELYLLFVSFYAGDFVELAFKVVLFRIFAGESQQAYACLFACGHIH